jgi:hypothetical protein
MANVDPARYANEMQALHQNHPDYYPGPPAAEEEADPPPGQASHRQAGQDGQLASRL